MPVSQDPARRARIIALLRQGIGVSAIASQEDCSPSLVYKIAGQEQITLRRPGRPSGTTDAQTEALRQEAIRLAAEEDMSAAQIADRLGRSVRAVQGYLRELERQDAPSPEEHADVLDLFNRLSLEEQEAAMIRIEHIERLEQMRWRIDVALDALRGATGHMTNETEEERALWTAKAEALADHLWYGGEGRTPSADALMLMDALTLATRPEDVLRELHHRGEHVLAWRLRNRIDEIACALEAWINEDPGAATGKERLSKWVAIHSLIGGGVQPETLERLWHRERSRVSKSKWPISEKKNRRDDP